MQSGQIEAGTAIEQLAGGMVTLTNVGLEFQPGIGKEQWVQVLRYWRKTKTLFAMGLADLIHYGRINFGKEAVDEALSQLEFDFQDARQAMAILELPAGVRDPFLTSEHYWILAKFELTADEQRKWAEAAIEHKLSARQLKLSIEKGKVVKEDDTSAPPTVRGFANIHGMTQQFRVWKSRLEPIEKWPLERKKEAFEELKEVVEFGNRLARELGMKLES